MVFEKVFAAAVFLASAQLCLGAAFMITNERSSSFQGMHEADIQKIEQLVKTLERVQSLTEAEHVKTFIEILCWGTDIGTDEQNQIFHAFNTDLLLSKDQLDDIEEKLKTRTTPDQTEKIMSILRKVTTDNPLQFGDGLIEFCVHAMNRAIDKPEDLITKQNLFEHVGVSPGLCTH